MRNRPSTRKWAAGKARSQDAEGSTTVGLGAWETSASVWGVAVAVAALGLVLA
jgi:hypothetical protein